MRGWGTRPRKPFFLDGYSADKGTPNGNPKKETTLNQSWTDDTSGFDQCLFCYMDNRAKSHYIAVTESLALNGTKHPRMVLG